MEKIASINIYLFGKPGWEFASEVTSETIRLKGDELKARLYEVADNLQKLCDNGWKYEFGLYDIMLTKNISKAAAKRELAKLGIEEEIIEFDEED